MGKERSLHNDLIFFQNEYGLKWKVVKIAAVFRVFQRRQNKEIFQITLTIKNMELKITILSITSSKIPSNVPKSKKTIQSKLYKLQDKLYNVNISMSSKIIPLHKKCIK